MSATHSPRFGIYMPVYLPWMFYFATDPGGHTYTPHGAFGCAHKGPLNGPSCERRPTLVSQIMRAACDDLLHEAELEFGDWKVAARCRESLNRDSNKFQPHITSPE